MRVIHIETKVVPLFGILDNEGNVIQKIPLSEPIGVGLLSKESFLQVHDSIVNAKGELQKRLDTQLAEQHQNEIKNEEYIAPDEKPPTKTKKKIE